MKRTIHTLILTFTLAAGPVLAQNQGPGGHCVPPTPDAAALRKLPPPPLMTGIGNASLPVTTRSRRAQAYFNQGLALFHCFWWNEALRAFQEAARLDPDCAMAYWGVYQTLANPWGNPDAETERKAALDRAKKASPRSSEREQAYIRAAEARESSPGEQGKAAYVAEMEALIANHPDETQAKLVLAVFLFQEDFPHGFGASGQPTSSRRRSIELIREVLKSHPDNAAAHHYWIHAVEGGPEPQSALESADRLARLVPRSGHMVHMPGHIYYRLGQHERARRAFLNSMRVEKAYMTRTGTKPEELWNYTHNLAYLGMNCAEDGRYREGLKWIGDGGQQADPMTFNIRYGFWDRAAAASAKILAAEPGPDLPPFVRSYQEGLAAFASGMAAVERSDAAEATRQTEILEQALKTTTEQTQGVEEYGIDFLPKILATALPELRGHVLSIQGDHAGAVARMKEALEREREVGYEEPPPYARPVLESLGQVYLRARDWQRARETFEQAFKHRPGGHALFGIARAYDLAGHTKEAVAAYRRFLREWRFADRDLPQVKTAEAAIRRLNAR